jgi:hypothetical protein
MKKIVFVSIISLLISCDDNADLKRSIFIADENAEGLPIYSEWGYNTFGAYYNREVIVSNDYEVPVQVIQQFNTTELRFRGQRGGSRWSGEVFSLNITLPNYTPLTHNDLISLDKTVIDLSDEDYIVSITDAMSTRQIEVLNGVFEIKRAQNLLVDGAPAEVILSGVFEFQAIIDGQPVSISEGRFDVGVGTYNFFVYD